jgi:predicted RNA binding protein YcfA (HicA-like mRNA interferase family)
MPFKSKDVLRRGGFEIRRQSGSHVVLRDSSGRQTYVPMHSKKLPNGTFRAILKQAGLTEEEFRSL